MALRSINPATEETIKEFSELSGQAIGQKLAAAQTAFESWRQTSFEERAKLMRRAAEELRKQKDELARIMTSEMGKTLAAAGAEVEKCATTCEYYAANAGQFLAPEPIKTDGSDSYVRFDPIGIVLAVMRVSSPRMSWLVDRFWLLCSTSRLLCPPCDLLSACWMAAATRAVCLASLGLARIS